MGHFSHGGFDIRIFYTSNIVTFWLNGPEKKEVVATWLKEIFQKLLTGDIIRNISPRFGYGFRGDALKQFSMLDVENLSIVFLGIIRGGKECIIHCDLASFISEDFELFDTSLFRVFKPKLLTPAKEAPGNENVPTRQTLYRSSCRYWENKIGNMDVAKYHLLIYEE